MPHQPYQSLRLSKPPKRRNMMKNKENQLQINQPETTTRQSLPTRKKKATTTTLPEMTRIYQHGSNC